MLQQRKKDYLQRLIEEFFARFQVLIDDGSKDGVDQKKAILNEAFDFFNKNLEVKQDNDAEAIITKIGDTDLLEQYAKLLMMKYEVVDIKEVSQLYTALDIVKYLEATNKTYSWDRTVLREDLLRILDENRE